SSQGVDLNGDGDTSDFVVHVRRLSTGETTNLGIAGFPLFFHGDDLFLNANEAAQGNTDLNGDGDASDLVVLKASLSTKAISNPGIPAGFVSPSDGDFSLLAVDEADAHADLNGDGDTSDQVYALQNWSTGTRTNLGLAAAQTGSPVVVGPG